MEKLKKPDKTIDISIKRIYNRERREGKILSARNMQVSPSGMAAASQAVPGEFDSRHLLHKSTSFDKGLVDFTYLYKIFISRKKDGRNIHSIQIVNVGLKK